MVKKIAFLAKAATLRNSVFPSRCVAARVLANFAAMSEEDRGRKRSFPLPEGMLCPCLLACPQTYEHGKMNAREIFAPSPLPPSSSQLFAPETFYGLSPPSRSKHSEVVKQSFIFVLYVAKKKPHKNIGKQRPSAATFEYNSPRQPH